MDVKFLFYFGVFLGLLAGSSASSDDSADEDPYTTTDPKRREPSPCEVCKFFTKELGDRLEKSGKSKEVIETGHGLDTEKKRIKYKYAELRLIEALNDPHICEKILEYNVHAERDGSNRYAKGQSETMSTLHGLVHKGVKVDLGIPYELWDKPSAEVSKMQRACFKLAEDYEDDIEEWFYNHQDRPIMDYICTERYLKGKDQKCLSEIYKPKGDSGKPEIEEENSVNNKERKSSKKKKTAKKMPRTDENEISPKEDSEDKVLRKDEL